MKIGLIILFIAMIIIAVALFCIFIPSIGRARGGWRIVRDLGLILAVALTVSGIWGIATQAKAAIIARKTVQETEPPQETEQPTETAEPTAEPEEEFDLEAWIVEKMSWAQVQTWAKDTFGEDWQEVLTSAQDSYVEDCLPQKSRERVERSREALQFWYDNPELMGISDAVWYPFMDVLEFMKTNTWQKMSSNEKVAYLDEEVRIPVYIMILSSPEYQDMWVQVLDYEFNVLYPEIGTVNPWLHELKEEYDVIFDKEQTPNGVVAFYTRKVVFGEDQMVKTDQFIQNGVQLCCILDKLEWYTPELTCDGKKSAYNWHMPITNVDPLSCRTCQAEEQESLLSFQLVANYKSGNPASLIGINAFDGRGLITKVKVPTPDTTTTTTTAANNYYYRLRYNANGGSNAPGNQNSGAITATSWTTTVSSTAPSREGYTFLGWATSSKATSAAYAAGNSITIGQAGGAGTEADPYTVTLYAVWQKNVVVNYYHYRLAYNANGGSGAPGEQRSGAITATSWTTTVSSTAPSREGYTFLGWATDPSAASASFGAGSAVTVGQSGGAGTEADPYTVVLYAVWQQNQVTNKDPAEGPEGKGTVPGGGTDGGSGEPQSTEPVAVNTPAQTGDNATSGDGGGNNAYDRQHDNSGANQTVNANDDENAQSSGTGGTDVNVADPNGGKTEGGTPPAKEEIPVHTDTTTTGGTDTTTTTTGNSSYGQDTGKTSDDVVDGTLALPD